MHLNRLIKLFLILAFICGNMTGQAQQMKAAQKPPMGWNSYGAYGSTVKESEVLENAGFMQTHLKDFGWQYVVVGYCWYFPYAGAMYNPKQVAGITPKFRMDKYGRLLPAPDRFPSAKGCHGFRQLASKIHRKGLKFGIHIMRGIPRQAVAMNLRIKGTRYRAKDIADTVNVCTWLNHNYGIDMDKPGAQEYYNSLFALYARWGVDFVKVDDISSPFYDKEIQAIRKAILSSGRPMVLSLASGETTVDHAENAKEYADMWRISGDVRDNWDAVLPMFGILHKWENYAGPGHYADADLLNIGQLSERGPVGEPHQSGLNRHELTSMLTLWAIARSPLMIGGDLTMMHAYELSLLQNRGMMEVNQNSSNNHELFRTEDEIGWIANVSGSEDKYLAVFNLGEHAKLIHIDLKLPGVKEQCTVTDVWTGEVLGTFQKKMRPEVLAHGARLLRISKME